MLLDAGELDRAEEAIHDALDLFPEQPALLHVLGSIRIARGELDAGLRLLQNAATASPDNLRLQRDLGLALVRRVLLAVGQKLARRGWLEQAEDVFLLSLDLVQAALRGRGSPQAVRAEGPGRQWETHDGDPQEQPAGPPQGRDGQDRKPAQL